MTIGAFSHFRKNSRINTATAKKKILMYFIKKINLEQLGYKHTKQIQVSTNF